MIRPYGGLINGSPWTDSAPPPPDSEFQFEYASFSTREDYGWATINVTRSSTEGTASVRYATGGGSAPNSGVYDVLGRTIRFGVRISD